MSKTLIIDLNDNPDIKDLVADKEMGDKVDLHTSIKAMDDQTLTLTIESASEGSDDEESEESDDSEESDESETPAVTPAKRPALGGGSY